MQAEADQNIVQLLLVIQGCCCRIDDHQQSMWALEQAKHRLLAYYQGHDVTNTEYVEHFKALVGVVETYRGAYGHKPGLVAMELVVQGMKPQDVDTADRTDIKKAKEVCRKRYLSCMLLHGANNSRYSQLKVDLSNNMTKGTDNFPKTIVKTMYLLTNYVSPPRLQRARSPDGKRLANVTNTEYVKHFKALVGVVETYRGVYGRKPGLVAMELVVQGIKPQDVDTADHAYVKKAKEVCCKHYLVCMLLRGADNSRYSQLKVDLSNDMTKGTDNFPKTIVETMCLLTDYVPRLKRARNPDGKGLAFVQGEGGASRGSKKDSANKVVE